MARIDHKDKLGEQRKAVFAEVQERVGFTGTPPKGASDFLGDWTYRFLSKTEPFAYKRFHADGRAPGKAVDGSFDNPNDRWRLNEDGSFSDWYYIEPMPEYGIEEAGHGEERYHVLFRDADTFILFNGDGSLIMIYERAKG